MVTLRPLKQFRFPVMADCITPDNLAEKSEQEIKAVKVWEGNRERNLGELFEIVGMEAEKVGESEILNVNGDVAEVRGIGSDMRRGEIVIRGNVGMHLGEGMRGGKITVYGNVGGWTGSMMRGGTIEIHGNASDYLGAPYRGSTDGIKGGKIIVHGSAGNEAGAYMRRGVLKIYGDAGQFVGFRMCEGTVYVQGSCASRAGACMTEGRIVVGGCLESVLPTFTVDSLRGKVKIEEGESVEGPFYVFLGDLAEEGNGKLYVSKEKNPHLSGYEKLL